MGWLPSLRAGQRGAEEVNVRLTQLDGALPNLALMKLSHWYKAHGHEVHLTREIHPDIWEGGYETVYGSAIFGFSQERLMRFQRQWPHAIIGGTGTPFVQTVEDLIGDYEHYDYSGYPGFTASIGFTQRGCRLKCKFCVVPTKEGKNRSVNRIAAIWRGVPHPKKLHLLDNDFFGQPEWLERAQEIIDGGFKVCLTQGINVRLINDESATVLARIEYRNSKFNKRKLYTAWDNLGDEAVFFKGVDCLERAGIPPTHLMAYMLIGYDKAETWERIWHRFNRIVERGIEPYPMVYDRSRADLLCFQRWVITGLYRIVPWNEYERSTKSIESMDAYNGVLKKGK
jgi:hypothetical protein